MRAALFDTYGGPEVLYEGTVPVPAVGPGEVLIKVHAVSVNGGELTGRAGRLRLITGRRFPKRIGIDFAGEIAAADPAVRGLGLGDRVWGALPRGRFGSAAEYVTVRPRQIALSPAGLSPPEAASLVVGTTAITALRDKARLRGGERLLVRGASGGVGSIAVQYGKALGAHVTGLAGPRNLDFVRALGADEALDYTTTHPGDLPPFDVIFDTVGTDHPTYHRLLPPGGRMVAIAFDIDHIGPSLRYIAASTRHGPRRIRFFSGNPKHPDFADLTRYTEAGMLRPVVDTIHPLSAIATAHQALEAGGVRGKHIIQIT
ncbi:NAD(P)-dependent alcohol dehydrogenase [Spongiactinospora rosea]|uniref:NAD(P)-dependent alcohol dehydrogenase n=2 Tax=Spongiactinospora rosea TaxID=2248750 RepID=A0A366LSB5_9ACTN|nr:NAD(P)-dependent alcohol dehydrogenase [Spongiactinospora rosea]